MLFFKLTDSFGAKNKETAMNEEAFVIQCQNATKEIMAFSHKNFFMTLVDNTHGEYTFGIAARNQESLQYYLTMYLKKIQRELRDFNYHELSFQQFVLFLQSSEKGVDTRYFFQKLGLEDLLDEHNKPLLNDVLAAAKPFSFNQLELYSPSFKAELASINKRDVSNNKRMSHYLLKFQNLALTQKLMHILINALREKNQLGTSRYTIVSMGKIIGKQQLGFAFLEKIYQMSINGTVAIGIPRMNEQVYEIWFKDLVTLINKYQQEVLTIIYTDETTDFTPFLLEKFSSIKMIPLQEEGLSLKKAQELLVTYAKRDHLKVDQLLKESLSGEVFTLADIKEVYQTWQKNKMQPMNHVKSETNSLETTLIEETKNLVISPALKELEKMIGLTSVKKAVDEAIAYNCLAQEMKMRHLKSEAVSRHMIFTGNPGTAKTTVARLFGKIMKDYGILSQGNFYEVGRSDLVASYIGQTAPKVKALFEKAKGSVLFIDEAYSLVDDDERHTFADEAISTIVQEMENNRDKMIVIFAGYPEKMQEFINKNPGLKSRIAREINFPDYTSEELYDIGKLEAEKKGLLLPDNIKSKFLEIIEEKYLADPKNFGNGRTARTIIEQGQMSLASRLFKKDLAKVTNEELTTLRLEDFQIGEENPLISKRIGFF